MKRLPKFWLLLILLLPLLFTAASRAENNSAVYDNLYLRVAPSTQNGVLDLYYKDKNGRWIKYNQITLVVTVGAVTQNAQTEKVSYTAEMLTDGLSSRPDLTRVKFQFDKFSNNAHLYIMMEIEQAKPYVKMSVFKNADSADVASLSLAAVGGLDQLVQKININAVRYDVNKCNTYSPGCNDIRTVADGTTFTLAKPDNKIITMIGETGVKQLMFFDQDFATGDKVETQVATKGAGGTSSVATASAKRKEEPWFAKTYLTRSPFSGGTNNWYFGVDVASIGATKPTPKAKRNLSFRIKFTGIDKNAGPKPIQATVLKGEEKIFDKKLTTVGTSIGVYVGTINDIPGTGKLTVLIKGPKHLTKKFALPDGVETVDWTKSALRGGDADGNDRVDSGDFAYLQRDYLQNIVSSADFNYDTRVDSQDFGILQDGYGKKAAKP